MKKRLSKLLATALVAAMIAGAIPTLMSVVMALPPTPPAFYIEPDSQTFLSPPTGVGDRFNETLYVSTTGDTFTYQYEVDFNPSQLKCVSAVYTAVTTSQFFAGHTTVPTGPTIDNTTGTISGGETLLGADVVHATAGASIINMTFQIAASPPINGNLTSLISLNPANTFLLDPDLATVPGVSYGSAAYVNIWASPPKPHLDVEPSTQSFNQFTNWNGTTFTEDIMIKSISSNWFLGNATTQLTYNNVLTSVAGVAFDPIWGTTAWSNPSAGVLQFDVSNPTSTPNGDVKIATITFTITDQGSVPPRPFGEFDVSTLHLFNFALGSTAGFYIATGLAVDGVVTVFAFSPSKPPHLEVSSVTIDRSVGFFNITVSFVDVRDFENIIGVQFRLGYNDTVLQPVAVYEGPFLGSHAVLQGADGSPTGTFFTSLIEDPDGAFGPHVIVGNLIFPNSTGLWNPPMPNGTGVTATITFKVLPGAQSSGEGNLTTPLNIVDQLAVALDNLVSQNIVNALLDSPVNGTVTITNNFPGRAIDLYGGAANTGRGNLVPSMQSYDLAFPAPYGGQGPNAPMDIVEPLSFVYLNAYLSYNSWPVQHKNVAFEIQEPDGSAYNKLTAFTDSNGIAQVGFRMPWPSDNNTNPESLFGVWNVTATVQLADITLNDTMSFHYDDLVHIWKVTTDKPEYNHGEPVQITFTYGSHAQQTYNVTFLASIVDNLGVTVGIATITTAVGGATVFGEYKNWTTGVTIILPGWAYSGLATVNVSAFDKKPSQGGAAITPEYVGPNIEIQPA